MRLYCGIDLHSTNSYLAVLNERLESVLDRRVPNRLEAVLGALEPFRAEVRAVAVESTFNWYWLVDGLMEEGYSVDLVNTSAVNRYEGLKYVDDRHDARWLARLLHLGILPTGHIYPKQERAVRDLLRRRAFLVRDRTAHLLSVKNLYSRNTGAQVAANELKRLTDEQVTAPKLRPEFELLKSIPGIGQTLALTIMYETGSIARFADAGHFCSYCRCVPSKHLSNGKVKGKGNVRNGNAYLSWAFMEAAHFAIRFEPKAKSFYERKKAKTHPMVALRAISHKLARASFHILRDQVPFRSELAFG